MHFRIPSTSVRLRCLFFSVRANTLEHLPVMRGRFRLSTCKEECFSCSCFGSSLGSRLQLLPPPDSFTRKRGLNSAFVIPAWKQYSVLPSFSASSWAPATAATIVAAWEPDDDMQRIRIVAARSSAGGRSPAEAGAGAGAAAAPAVPVGARGEEAAAGGATEVVEGVETMVANVADVRAAAIDKVGATAHPAEVAIQTSNATAAADPAAYSPCIDQTSCQKAIRVPKQHFGQAPLLCRELQPKQEKLAKGVVLLSAERRLIGGGTMWSYDKEGRDRGVCSSLTRSEHYSCGTTCTCKSSNFVSTTSRDRTTFIRGSISNSSTCLPHYCSLSSSATVPPVTLLSNSDSSSSSTSACSLAPNVQSSRTSSTLASPATSTSSPATSTHPSAASLTSLSAFSPGLEGVIAGESAVSSVSAEGTGLCYRGYPIEELVAGASFEEVLFLLLKKRLPTEEELQQQQHAIAAARRLPPLLAKSLECIPAHAHPMDVLRCACSMLGILEPETNPSSDPPEIGLRLVSIYASVLFYWHFFSEKGIRINVETRPTDSIAAHFFKLLHYDEPEYKVDPLEEHALNVSFILYAEHEFNASTFAARVTAATGSDIYSAMCSAIGTLRGHLHGGANEAALHFLSSLSSPQQAEETLRKMWLRKEKVMGFGHRMYRRKGDPRTPLLMQIAEDLALRPHQCSKKQQQEERLIAVAKHVQKLMLIHKGLYPNVDFPSAIVYFECNIPVSFFTPLFAIARTTGWTAHIIEQREKNRLIRPLSLYTGPQRRSYLPLLERELQRKDKKKGEAAATEAATEASTAALAAKADAAAAEANRKQRQQQQQQMRPQHQHEWQAGAASSKL